MKSIQIPDWADRDRYYQEGPEKIRLPMSEKTRRFVKRYAIAAAVIVLLGIWTATVRTITAHNVRIEVAEELSERYEAEYRQKMQAYIDQQTAAQLLTGEASRQAAAEEDANWIARVLYGVRNNSSDDLRTCVWCILNRVDNAAYPGSVAAVVRQAEQWMGYAEDNPVLTDLYKIALEQVESWYAGDQRPVDSSYVYLSWSPTEIVLRDAWTDGSGTHYWRWKEDGA